DHAALGAVISRSGFENIDKMREALIDAVNRVAPVMGVIPKEAIARRFLFVLDMFLHACLEDHVVDPLEGVSCDARILLDELEIILQGSFPVQLLILLWAL